MFPPGKPNVAGLTPPKTPLNTKAVTNTKERPAWWGNSSKKILENNIKLGLAFNLGPQIFYICYLCGDTGKYKLTGVAHDKEHITDWKGIINKLISDGKTKSITTLALDYSWCRDISDLFIEDTKTTGKYVPTQYAAAIYSNDLDNLLWSHGNGCNQSKSSTSAKAALNNNNYSTITRFWAKSLGEFQINNINDIDKAFKANTDLRVKLAWIKKSALAIATTEMQINGDLQSKMLSTRPRSQTLNTNPPKGASERAETAHKVRKHTQTSRLKRSRSLPPETTGSKKHKQPSSLSVSTAISKARQPLMPGPIKFRFKCNNGHANYSFKPNLPPNNCTQCNCTKNDMSIELICIDCQGTDVSKSFAGIIGAYKCSCGGQMVPITQS